MARKEYGGVGLVPEDQRAAVSLKRSHKLLFEANEEFKKAALKYELMAKMSHELRGSLNIIIGFAELMLDEVPGKINKKQRQSLNDILNSGKRLLALINDFDGLKQS
jgi:signal transduction histidine kinase